MRIGIGYDIHRLVTGRDLFLGGVRIPFDKGLLGHSDADVLLHAICDALLGAVGLDDIGHHFPDTSPEYENVSSLILLRKVNELVRKHGFVLCNLDSVIFAQIPKIGPFREAMRAKISQSLKCGPERVNIKATTTEKLGVIGKGRGIAAMCTALIVQGNFED